MCGRESQRRMRLSPTVASRSAQTLPAKPAPTTRQSKWGRALRRAGGRPSTLPVVWERPSDRCERVSYLAPDCARASVRTFVCERASDRALVCERPSEEDTSSLFACDRLSGLRFFSESPGGGAPVSVALSTSAFIDAHVMSQEMFCRYSSAERCLAS